jgi:glutamate 5-kinase
MKTRASLPQAKRWVIKIGSALLTADGRGLDRPLMATWVAQIVAMRRRGLEVVVVSSGAVAEGMQRLGWKERPSALHQLQAAAAVGQMGLVEAYESEFQKYGMHTAQILLTHDDLSNRGRYLNSRNTLRELVGLGVIPVINENDTVATDEIRFGDNDTLAALVTNLVEADVLVILTDQKGMFDRDPRAHADAQLLSVAQAGDPALEVMAGGASGRLGRGGMLTKVRAAKLAARSGAGTVIAFGRDARVLEQIAQGEDIGTLIVPAEAPLDARKQWLAGHLRLAGSVVLDDGAVHRLVHSGSSLLPVGVRAVQGEFVRGEVVACLAPDGREVARGLINYSAAEALKIMGQPSDRIEGILGYVDAPELIHRDNLVMA